MIRANEGLKAAYRKFNGNVGAAEQCLLALIHSLIPHSGYEDRSPWTQCDNVQMLKILEHYLTPLDTVYEFFRKSPYDDFLLKSSRVLVRLLEQDHCCIDLKSILVQRLDRVCVQSETCAYAGVGFLGTLTKGIQASSSLSLSDAQGILDIITNTIIRTIAKPIAVSTGYYNRVDTMSAIFKTLALRPDVGVYFMPQLVECATSPDNKGRYHIRYVLGGLHAYWTLVNNANTGTPALIRIADVLRSSILKLYPSIRLAKDTVDVILKVFQLFQDIEKRCPSDATKENQTLTVPMKIVQQILCKDAARHEQEAYLKVLKMLAKIGLPDIDKGAFETVLAVAIATLREGMGKIPKVHDWVLSARIPSTCQVSRNVNTFFASPIRKVLDVMGRSAVWTGHVTRSIEAILPRYRHEFKLIKICSRACRVHVRLALYLHVFTVNERDLTWWLVF